MNIQKEYQEILDDAIKLADRREAVMKQVKPCPACGNKQVQLISWMEEPIWRCRGCRKEFSA